LWDFFAAARIRNVILKPRFLRLKDLNPHARNPRQLNAFLHFLHPLLASMLDFPYCFCLP
jgi:hypothetical protein